MVAAGGLTSGGGGGGGARTSLAAAAPLSTSLAPVGLVGCIASSRKICRGLCLLIYLHWEGISDVHEYYSFILFLLYISYRTPNRVPLLTFIL